MAEDFNPDAYLASKGAATPEPASVTQMAMNQFDPDQYLNQKNNEMSDKQQALYGGTSQQALAAVEGAARGVSLGGSDILESKLGIDTPENILGRRNANPKTAFASNIAGSAALIGLTGGLAAPGEAALIARGVAPVVARSLALGAEGAVFGAGNAVSSVGLNEIDLGNPNEAAQKIAADIGMGAILGGGLGVLSSGLEATPALFRRAIGRQSLAEKAAQEATASVSNLEAPQGVVDAPDSGIAGIKDSSISDIQARVKEAGYRGEHVEMPQKAALQDAASRVPLLNPVHNLQLESLDSQGARDLYKTGLEMQGKEGDALRNYEALQKKELTGYTDQTIKDLSPKLEPTSDAVESGKRVIDAFTKQYDQEKALLEPAFKAIDKTPVGEINHLPGVLDNMVKAVPGVAKMVSTEGGEIGINPYSTKWGIDKATYTAAKDAINALKEGVTNFRELANIRKGLDQNIDILAKGQAPREIMALKKSMMDYMQNVLDAAGSGSDASNVRNIFKRYAINEEQRHVIEKHFGASVGSPEFGSISKVKPEKIVDNIFRDTASVNAAKNILGKEKFSEVLANHLAEQRALATTDGAFSSRKFGSYLKKNQDALQAAFSDNPGALQRLKDLTTIMRILPDSASINPSGTAKTLLGILKATSLGELLGNAKAYGQEKLGKHLLLEQIDQSLKGAGEKAQQLNTLKGITDKITGKIEDGAKKVFSSPVSKSLATQALTNLSDTSYNKNVKQVRELAGDDSAMMNHLSKDSEALYAAAPNITQSLHGIVVAGAQFLHSKIPGPLNPMLFNDSYEASQAQKDKFNRYYEAVNEPLTVFDKVRDGSLSNETMEAMSAVYPDLLQSMREKVIAEIKPNKIKNLSYPAKLSISKFLGQPLDTHMMPQSLMSYQQSLSGPQMSNQSGPKDRTTVAGLQHMDVAKRSATRTQQEEEES